MQAQTPEQARQAFTAAVEEACEAIAKELATLLQLPNGLTDFELNKAVSLKIREIVTGNTSVLQQALLQKIGNFAGRSEAMSASCLYLLKDVQKDVQAALVPHPNGGRSKSSLQSILDLWQERIATIKTTDESVTTILIFLH